MVGGFLYIVALVGLVLCATFGCVRAAHADRHTPQNESRFSPQNAERTHLVAATDHGDSAGSQVLANAFGGQINRSGVRLAASTPGGTVTDLRLLPVVSTSKMGVIVGFHF